MANKEYLNVNELATLFGLNVQTLHYYDKIGILKPSYRDPKNGYRKYRFDQTYKLAVILGRYTPFGMFGAALLFGAANALQIRLQTIGVSISPFLLAILPYALTLIAMLGAAGKNSEPEALAKPYVKGSR